MVAFSLIAQRAVMAGEISERTMYDMGTTRSHLSILVATC